MAKKYALGLYADYSRLHTLSLSPTLSLSLSLFETGNQNCRIANAVRIVFTLNFCKVPPQDRENEKDGVTDRERQRERDKQRQLVDSFEAKDVAI